MEEIRKEAIVDYFILLARYSHGSNVKNHGKIVLRLPLPWFEPEQAQIWITHTPKIWGSSRICQFI